jgi:hypothetical protein
VIVSSTGPLFVGFLECKQSLGERQFAPRGDSGKTGDNFGHQSKIHPGFWPNVGRPSAKLVARAAGQSRRFFWLYFTE